MRGEAEHHLELGVAAAGELHRTSNLRLRLRDPALVLVLGATRQMRHGRSVVGTHAGAGLQQRLGLLHDAIALFGLATPVLHDRAPAQCVDQGQRVVGRHARSHSLFQQPRGVRFVPFHVGRDAERREQRALPVVGAVSVVFERRCHGRADPGGVTGEVVVDRAASRNPGRRGRGPGGRRTDAVGTLGGLEPVVGFVDAAHLLQRRGPDQAEPGVGEHCVAREPVEPTQQGLEASEVTGLQPVAEDQLRGLGDVAGGRRMSDRVGAESTSRCQAYARRCSAAICSGWISSSSMRSRSRNRWW